MINLDADANIKLREGSFPALLPRLGCGHRNYQSGSIIDFSRWSAPGAYLCLFVRGLFDSHNPSCPVLPGFAFDRRDDEVFDVFEGLLVVVGCCRCCCHDMCGYTCPLPGAPTSRNIDSWPALLPTLPFATFHPLFHLQPYGSQFAGYFYFVYLCF